MTVPTLTQVRSWSNALGDLGTMAAAAHHIALELGDRGANTVATSLRQTIYDLDWSGDAKASADRRADHDQTAIRAVAQAYGDLADAIAGACAQLEYPVHRILELVAHAGRACRVAEDDPEWHVTGSPAATTAAELRDSLLALAHAISDADSKWAPQIAKANHELSHSAGEKPAAQLAAYNTLLGGDQNKPTSESAAGPSTSDSRHTSAAGAAPDGQDTNPASEGGSNTGNGAKPSGGGGDGDHSSNAPTGSTDGGPTNKSGAKPDASESIGDQADTVTKIAKAVDTSVTALGDLIEKPIEGVDKAATAITDLVEMPLQFIDKTVSLASDIGSTLLEDANKVDHALHPDSAAQAPASGSAPAAPPHPPPDHPTSPPPKP